MQCNLCTTSFPRFQQSKRRSRQEQLQLTRQPKGKGNPPTESPISRTRRNLQADLHPSNYNPQPSELKRSMRQDRSRKPTTVTLWEQPIPSPGLSHLKRSSAWTQCTRKRLQPSLWSAGYRPRQSELQLRDRMLSTLRPRHQPTQHTITLIL